LSDQLATGTLHRTCLYEEHLRLGARMVSFAGWEMPLQYSGIVEEHRAVRERAGMFDVSHMGRIEVHGPAPWTAQALRHVCAYDITRLQPGQGHYTVICREDGGILDDVYVFCLLPQRYLVVANAANRKKIFTWIEEHIRKSPAYPVDRTLSTAMIAVQGSEALTRLGQVIGGEFVGSLRPRQCAETKWPGVTASLFASRTGYTGEDGLELVVPMEAGPTLWRALLDLGVQPCGLGARDTLRLEASLLLYGNDMDEDANPWEVGLGWVVTLDDGADFIGREALIRLREAGPQRLLVCLRAQERGIMRDGYSILRSGREVGKVTSGGYSPTLAVSIGMGFIPPELTAEGTELTVDVRGRPLPVRVVPRPFYKMSRKA